MKEFGSTKRKSESSASKLNAAPISEHPVYASGTSLAEHAGALSSAHQQLASLLITRRMIIRDLHVEWRKRKDVDAIKSRLSGVSDLVIVSNVLTSIMGECECSHCKCQRTTGRSTGARIHALPGDKRISALRSSRSSENVSCGGKTETKRSQRVRTSGGMAAAASGKAHTDPCGWCLDDREALALMPPTARLLRAPISTQVEQGVVILLLLMAHAQPTLESGPCGQRAKRFEMAVRMLGEIVRDVAVIQTRFSGAPLDGVENTDSIRERAAVLETRVRKYL
eukprot:TRINITY_DN15905_c0_g1_i1.p1 TRINITY_DN15905_c0_g1~~TRINITY_DN15905_c0_g1_i1.p1  ORF type:complete len:311 (+),score=27.68 TRINITY_DN15905_c0_g1_i1:88-933(+)